MSDGDYVTTGRLHPHARPTSRATLAGLSIGFLGVELLVLRGGHQQGVTVPELLIVVGASPSWALGSWASSRLPMPNDAATGTAVEMLIGGTVLAGLGPVGALLLGEKLTTTTLLGGAIILLAIALVIRAAAQPPASPQTNDNHAATPDPATGQQRRQPRACHSTPSTEIHAERLTRPEVLGGTTPPSRGLIAEKPAAPSSSTSTSRAGTAA